MTARRSIALLAGSFVALRLLRRSRERGPVCDVCFQRVEADSGTCPHCGTGFDDPERALHDSPPDLWVAAQVRRLRAMSYEELLAQLDSPQHFEVPADHGACVLHGETEVYWDGREKTDLRVLVGIWSSSGGRPLACDDFIRAPDGSFVGEEPG